MCGRGDDGGFGCAVVRTGDSNGGEKWVGLVNLITSFSNDNESKKLLPWNRRE